MGKYVGRGKRLWRKGGEPFRLRRLRVENDSSVPDRPGCYRSRSVRYLESSFFIGRDNLFAVTYRRSGERLAGDRILDGSGRGQKSLAGEDEQHAAQNEGTYMARVRIHP